MSARELEPLAYSIDNAAKIMSVSRPTIYLWIKDGRLRSKHIGGRHLIPASALRELIEGIDA